MINNNKNDYLQMRISKKDKQTIEDAAAHINKGMSEFVISEVLKKSEEILNFKLTYASIQYQKDIKDITFELTKER
jgi:uncharacterized protein (DUF1778 family)